jgi:DNA-binding IclR family transcriptional regulator
MGGMSQELVKSAARALDILEVFAARREPLTSSELGATLGYPKSSLSVLLRSLVAQGYLSIGPSDQSFFPTLKLARLGDWIAGALLGSEMLLPTLAQLRDVTSETVTLTAPADLQMRCLHALVGTHPISLQVEEGVTFPLIGTAIGTAWLSAQDERTVRELLDRWTKQSSARGRPSLDAIEAAIIDARALGYATAYDAVLPDTGAIAMPIRTSGVGETLIVAVAGLSNRIRRSEAKIVRAMRQLLGH